MKSGHRNSRRAPAPLPRRTAASTSPVRDEVMSSRRGRSSRSSPPTISTTVPITRPRPCQTAASTSRGSRICGVSGRKRRSDHRHVAYHLCKPGLSMTRFSLLFLMAGALAAADGDPNAELPIDKSATATVELKGYPDWLEIGFDSVWVSNPGLGNVQRLDPKTNTVTAEVKINRPVAAMAVGFGSVWVASRGDRSIVRIDAKTNTVSAAVPVAIADTESSTDAGEGGGWGVTAREGVHSR